MSIWLQDSRHHMSIAANPNLGMIRHRGRSLIISCSFRHKSTCIPHNALFLLVFLLLEMFMQLVLAS